MRTGCENRWECVALSVTGSKVGWDITARSTVSYLRCLQTADDVEGCVRILVHLEEEEVGDDSKGFTLKSY